MAIPTSELSLLLNAAFPGATITVDGGDGKYQVQIVAEEFVGLNRVKRQQAVYKVLNEHIQSGAVHAINMQLQTPSEHNQAG